MLNMVTHGHDGLVADMAAGTGKLTRMLAGAGVAVIAVEPSAAMRTVLRSVTRVKLFDIEKWVVDKTAAFEFSPLAVFFGNQGGLEVVEIDAGE